MSLDARYPLLAAAAAVIGAGLAALDLLAEPDSITLAEFIFDSIEKTLIVIGAAGVFMLIRRTHQQHKEQMALIEALGIARAEGADWRGSAQAYRSGLGAEIARQFRHWGLSEAEQEIGWMLLKGLSHKEIASLRGTAESTVRQQARLLYSKSGLPGKTAFAAFFLEDLLPSPGVIGRLIIGRG
ncbi:MAG: LuxR family transcriptional regulator [Pseudomonadota bacterium]|nr:LuxR family transcriptional regulator [Pseudomonadota bacterium]